MVLRYAMIWLAAKLLGMLEEAADEVLKR